MTRGARSLGATGFGLALGVLALAWPANASAHLRTGTVAVDYRASLADPVTRAYAVQIFQSDRGLRATVTSGHTFTLLGYLGEPVFTLGPRGLSVNAASPTAVVAGLLPKRDLVRANGPRWRLSAGRRSATWHDARAQGLPRGVERGTFAIPILVDGRHATVRGLLMRYPAPLLWPWVVAVLGLVCGALVLLRAPAEHLVRQGAARLASLAAAAATVAALAFAFDGYASAGTWIEGLDEIAFLAAGIWALARGPRQWRPAAAGGIGLVALAVGLSKGAVFLHPIVLAVLPAVLVRALVVVCLGAGIGAAALGASIYARDGSPA